MRKGSLRTLYSNYLSGPYCALHPALLRLSGCNRCFASQRQLPKQFSFSPSYRLSLAELDTYPPKAPVLCPPLSLSAFYFSVSGVLFPSLPLSTIRSLSVTATSASPSSNPNLFVLVGRMVKY